MITSPEASATPSPTNDFLVIPESALTIGESTTKPESQKMGMDTRNPVAASASSSLPLPKSFRNVYAMRLAAPEISKIRPIITPRPIMMPILPRVPPNPLVIELTMLTVTFSPAAFVTSVAANGIPPMIPTITVVMISARNVCTLVFRTSTIRIAIPIRSPVSILVPSITIIISYVLPICNAL